MEWTEKEVDELFRLIDRYEALFEKFELRGILFNKFGNGFIRTALIEMPMPIWKTVKSIKEGRVLFFKIIKKEESNHVRRKRNIRS